MNDDTNNDGCTYVLSLENCSIKDTPDSEAIVVQNPPCPTPPDPIEGTVIDPEPSVECPIPNVTLKGCEGDCKWYNAVCVSSTPPAIPCAPIQTGWGQWDGGTPKWSQACLSECEKEVNRVCRPERIEYIQHNWHHVLDLNTHPDWYSWLYVSRNGEKAKINVREFTTLAVKLARLAQLFNAVPEQNVETMGLGYVQNGEDGDGNPAYALSLLQNGDPIGTVFPLVAEYDGSGTLISISLPLPTPPAP